MADVLHNIELSAQNSNVHPMADALHHTAGV
eukprot:CAMPEP_0174371584 /NCGR_PEP_ID=MMETSP0811_2-20130205/100292_1 /TAXON_ID=73025 ORGANISM="Eutreptiella gymnastica-like, Strain CCMP1594" /NCGR_SAMPLE_ID=MMETSP0811_2 /ASSEMBLY_ACC=CAM_ASM_000667 /LENGTH=30 /DNA_ID= /DNA_START= /DNA_END= /DNA_ORIENTATION=